MYFESRQLWIYIEFLYGKLPNFYRPDWLRDQLSLALSSILIRLNFFGLIRPLAHIAKNDETYEKDCAYFHLLLCHHNLL